MESLIHAAVLGLVQGLTEFLPISSSAHLILVPKFLGWNDPFADFRGVRRDAPHGHAGGAADLLPDRPVAVPRRVAGLDPRPPDRRRPQPADRLAARHLGRSRRPSLGAAFESTFDTTFREQIAWIAVFALVGAALLWLAERWGTRTRGLEAMTRTDAAVIGVGQARGPVPGHQPLRDHDRDGPVPRPRARRGRPLQLPHVGPGHRRGRHLQGAHAHRLGVGAARRASSSSA